MLVISIGIVTSVSWSQVIFSIILHVSFQYIRCAKRKTVFSEIILFDQMNKILYLNKRTMVIITVQWVVTIPATVMIYSTMIVLMLVCSYDIKTIPTENMRRSSKRGTIPGKKQREESNNYTLEHNRIEHYLKATTCIRMMTVTIE